VLPLILYVEAINEVENFENNFKYSALIDFNSYIFLKKQELDLDSDDEHDSLIQNKTSTKIPVNILSNYYELICNCHQEISDQKMIYTEEEKEILVDIIFEYEGYYSINKSSNLIFSGWIKDNNKIAKLLYSMIIFLFFFMCVSIYLGLYNFFINKTLVVNIFLQINK
jgi:hypothetical protein